MALFNWTQDAESGVYKSHAMSSKLYEKALEESHFMEWVRPVDGFGKKKGETVTLIRLSDVAEPSSAVLSENIRIPEDSVTMSSTSITVTEIGRALPYTSLAMDLSTFDLENPIQAALKNQQRLTLDTSAATAFKLTKIVYTPTGVASHSISTTGVDGEETVGSNMNMYHVEECRDYLYTTMRAPKASGDDYVAIFATKSLRGIKRDPAWEQWKVYTTPEVKATGEIGRVEGIRFIETNHGNALTNGVGPDSQLGEGLIFGSDAVAIAEAQTPELRASQATDFGRQRSIAWYGVLAFGLIWDTAEPGEAKIIYVTGADL